MALLLLLLLLLMFSTHTSASKQHPIVPQVPLSSPRTDARQNLIDALTCATAITRPPHAEFMEGWWALLPDVGNSPANYLFICRLCMRQWHNLSHAHLQLGS
jgi:hypothetical protein